VRNRSRANDLLLLSLGATVGVIAGALLADRAGGLDRLLARGRRRANGTDALPEHEHAEVPYGLHDADGAYEDEDLEASDLDHDAFDDDEAAAAAFGDDAFEDDELAIADGGGGAGWYAAPRRDAVPDVLTLETRVLEAFHNDPVLRERAIDIGAIAPGVIELTGWVHDADEVKHALTLARGVPDVQHVVDQLAVRQPRRNRRATDRMALDLAEPAAEPAGSESPTRPD
jgi:hypothetical protein